MRHVFEPGVEVTIAGFTVASSTAAGGQHNVVPNRGREQETLLKRDANQRAQRLTIDRGDVVAVDRNRSRIGVDHPDEEVVDGRLPRSGRSDERHGFARCDFEGHTVQHLDTALARVHADTLAHLVRRRCPIGEGDVVEPDAHGAVAVGRHHPGAIDFVGFVEHLVNPADRHHRPRQFLQEEPEDAHRHRQQ